MNLRYSDRYLRRPVLQTLLSVLLILSSVTTAFAQEPSSQDASPDTVIQENAPSDTNSSDTNNSDTNNSDTVSIEVVNPEDASENTALEINANSVFLPAIQSNQTATQDNREQDATQNNENAVDITAAAAPVNNPPVAPLSILVFPQRNFVSAAGYGPSDLVVVKVIHPSGVIVSTDPNNPIVPQQDPLALPGDPFAGIVEVNHPGGACWFGVTPDIRPGDVVQIDIVGGPNVGLHSDATTVSNVTAQRPVQLNATTVQVHGTAQTAAGAQIPIAQLEQRLVAPGGLFAKNGKRTLRASSAGIDGTLAYDAAGSINWTATYSALSAADVTLALQSESRGMWLGSNPAAAVEGTIYEIGIGIIPGAQPPCTAPLEVLPPPAGSELIPPTTPTGLAANVVNSSTVNLSWTAATDNVGVTSYGVYRDGIRVSNVQNAAGTAPAPTTFVDKNVPPGTYSYQVDAADAVGNRSTLSISATVTTAGQPAANLPAHSPPAAPVSIIGFPSRDFVSAAGYLATDTVDVQIIRNGFIVSTASGIIPQPDPNALPADPFAGLVEVNHVGAACWEGVTPDLRPGDIVRTIAFQAGGVIRTVDQTTVSNVTAQRPIAINANTVVVHGTAKNAAGLQIPIDQIEQRMIAKRDAFDRNGKRTLRASAGVGIDGVLAYDSPISTNWTVTYTNLTANDVARAVGGTTASGQSFVGAESRILWLGSLPALGTELTIFENSDAAVGGPTVGCTAPAELPAAKATFSPATLNFGNITPPATSVAQNVNFQNTGTAPMTITAVYLAGLNPGDFLITANTCPAVLGSGLSCTVSVAFRPTDLGARQANLSFADTAPNTTFQSIALNGTGATNIVAPGTPARSMTAGSSVIVNATLANSTAPVRLTWTASPSAITNYQVQQSVNGAAFADTATQPLLATNLTLNLAMGTTAAPNSYQFRVRACLGASCSAWATGFSFSTLPVDESNSQFVSFNGTWTSQARAGTYGGTRRFSSTTNSFGQIQNGKITLTSPGSIAFIAIMQSDSGRANISIDGGAPVTVDLYSAVQRFGAVAFVANNLAAGTHSIRVTVLGTHNVLSTGNFVDVDAFVFLK